MRVNNHNKIYRDVLPEDVVAVLDLFPDLWLNIGDGFSYFDVHDGENYIFIQSIAISGTITDEQNKKRFISWVRAGMPEGCHRYDTAWEKEE